MRATPHPDAPFQLTLPGPGHHTRWTACLLLSVAAVVLASGLGLTTPAALGTGLGLAAVLVAALVPPARVVAHVDRHGIAAADGSLVPWLDVARLEVAAVGAAHLLRVHGHDGVLRDVDAQESPPATLQRITAAKVAGLVPGWVRVDALTQLRIVGPTDRGPRPRPDLAA